MIFTCLGICTKYAVFLIVLRRAKRSAWKKEDDESWRRAAATLDTVNRSENLDTVVYFNLSVK